MRLNGKTLKLTDVVEQLDTDESLTLSPFLFTSELIKDTTETWSPLYGHDLTQDEAVDILMEAGLLLDIETALNLLELSQALTDKWLSADIVEKR